MPKPAVLDIGEVADLSGMPVSKLRYYEEIGLIASVGRNGLRRQFDRQVLLQLSLITMGRAAGFSLDEIRKIFDAKGRPTLPRQELHAKADELDQMIGGLTALRNTLRHVADCPAPSHLECERFQKLIRLARRDRPGRVADPGKF